jgi:hypothetical protein
MPALVQTTITANGTYNFQIPTGGKNAFQATIALWGSLGAGTPSWNLGFYDSASPPVLHVTPIPAAGGVPPVAINTCGFLLARADVLQLVLTGATSPTLGVWIG